MPAPTAVRRHYHHNIRNAVCAIGDPHLFDGIPDSTQRSWIRRGRLQVVSFGDDTAELLVRIQRLERDSARLRNVIRLLLALIRAFGLSLRSTRVRDAAGKRTLMRAVQRASETIPRLHVFRVCGEASRPRMLQGFRGVCT